MFLLLNFLNFLSSYKAYFLNDESENDGSESGSAGTCAFPFCFDESVGRVGDSVVRFDDSVGCVRGMKFGVFVPTGIESIGEIVPLVAFIPKGVKTKGS